jgi:hypothetical protein
MGLIVSSTAVAQAAAPGQPPVMPQAVRGQAPVYDPAQLPSFNGKVQQFTLTPRGDIDGFILADGTEVKTPPHLSTAVAYAIKAGDSVTIHGLRAAAIPLLQATLITDHTSGRTIVDAGPGPGPAGPLGASGRIGTSEARGSVRMSLHGPQGEINGALLTDGTVLRLPPDAAATVDSLLQAGQVVVAQGDEVSNPIGRVLDVRAIGSSLDNLTPIEGPPPSGVRGRGWAQAPPPGAPPPPPPAPGTG